MYGSATLRCWSSRSPSSTARGEGKTLVPLSFTARDQAQSSKAAASAGQSTASSFDRALIDQASSLARIDQIPCARPIASRMPSRICR
jgi:hypothetical protein